MPGRFAMHNPASLADTLGDLFTAAYLDTVEG